MRQETPKESIAASNVSPGTRTGRTGQEKRLTALEVADIIKACGDAQVRVLKYAGLYVEFSRKEDSQAPEQVGVVLAPHVPAAEIAAKQAEQERKVLAQVDLDAREEEIRELQLTDPEEYEKLVINGDLDEETKDGGEENA